MVEFARLGLSGDSRTDPFTREHGIHSSPRGSGRIPVQAQVRCLDCRFFRSTYGCAESYASGYGEDGDLYCGETVRVDPQSGEFVLDDQGNLQTDAGGILIRWAEVEYAQFLEVDG
jgi:hypothetical protein